MCDIYLDQRMKGGQKKVLEWTLVVIGEGVPKNKMGEGNQKQGGYGFGQDNDADFQQIKSALKISIFYDFLKNRFWLIDLTKIEKSIFNISPKLNVICHFSTI